MPKNHAVQNPYIYFFKGFQACLGIGNYGDPDWIRTSDPQLRRTIPAVFSTFENPRNLEHIPKTTNFFSFSEHQQKTAKNSSFTNHAVQNPYKKPSTVGCIYG